jgi:hypothetical protein
MFQQNQDRLRRFLFEPRNVERLQNLLLFALVSYAKSDKPASTSTETTTKPSN